MLRVNNLTGFGARSVAGGNDAFTALLVHCDGADASTTFTDVSIGGAGSPHTVTANGNAQVDTAQSKFGGASALFDGTGDFLSIPDHADFTFGSGDFTIDFWIRAANVTNGFKGLFHKRMDSSEEGPFLIAQDGTGGNGTRIDLFMSSNGTSWDIASASQMGTIAATTWTHIALARSGSTIYKFVGGVSGETITSSASLFDNAAPVMVGSDVGGSGWPGHVDEVRISKGVARWTANFTPPTAPYS